MAAAAPWEVVLLALAPDAPDDVAELPLPVPVLVPDPAPVSVPVLDPVLVAEPVVDAPVPLTAV